MRVVRRKLFWKVYLTLLGSLFAATVLMGGIGWLVGDTPRARLSAIREELARVPARASTAASAEQVRRVGDEGGADLSLYGEGGALVGSRGQSATGVGGSAAAAHGLPIYVRIDLGDGRTALVRWAPPGGHGLPAILAAVLAISGGVGMAAYPVTARVTRRLERLRASVERWGQTGEWRLDGSGSDEVAVLARTFDGAASRIQALVEQQRALLANASHELRSPLARLRIAIDLLPARHADGRRDEIVRSLAELDALVDEILLSSRLGQADPAADRFGAVGLLGLAAEEAARVGAQAGGEDVAAVGDEALLRRLIRNLLDNAARHGRPPVHVAVERSGPRGVRFVVTDAGDGVPPTERERIFDPFYRPNGYGEAAGGWGLGLALVRQIADRHGGSVACETDPAGGSCFVVDLVAWTQTEGTDGMPEGSSARRNDPG